MVLCNGTSAIAVDDYKLTDADKHFLSAIQNMSKEESDLILSLYRALQDPPVREQILEILFGGNENDE